MAINIRVNSLNFDNIKDNLKTHLSSTAVFKDYDFEGSGLSVLLDLLAYTTYYQGAYNNFVANEMFIATAEQRSSVVSHAKTLGYSPRSRTAPTATVNVRYGSTPSSSTLRAGGAIFTTRVNNKSVKFTNVSSATIDLTATGTADHIVGLDIKEGVIRNISSVVPSNRKYQTVVIPDTKVDTSTISVTVQNSVSDSTGITNSWTKATNLASITGGTRAYFVEQDYSGKYSVVFGDGVIGATLAPGNLVTISYLSTNGPLANGAGGSDVFGGTQSFTLSSGTTVSTITPASGGAEQQSVESIRRTAPKAYAAQNRAVTAADFKALVENNFSGFSSISVYGGEDLSPPVYGKVFISLKSNVNETVTDTLQREIKEYLVTKCPLSIQPEVVIPELVHVSVETQFTYDPQRTPLSLPALQEVIRSVSDNYLQANTQDFDTAVSKTLLEKAIIDTDAAITSLNSTLRLEKRVIPLSAKTNYIFDFGTEIFHPHEGHSSVVFSNTFIYFDESTGTEKEARVRDDGRGKLILFELTNGIESTIDSEFGTVDYVNGVVSFDIATLSLESSSDSIRVNMIPASNIVRSQRNLVLTPSAAPTATTGLVSEATTSTTSTTTTVYSSGSGGGDGGGGGGGGYGGY